MFYHILFSLFLMLSQPVQATTIINMSTLVTQDKIDDINLSIKAETLRKATVKVITPAGGHGSGALFKIKKHVIVITAAHVVDNWEVSMIETEAGVMIARTVYVDFASDIAVLSFDRDEITPDLREIAIRFRTSPKIAGVGTDIFYSSYPANHDKLTFDGTVAGYWTDEEDFYIMADGFVWPGVSGSIVFDKQGRVIGVVTSIQVGKLSGYDFAWQGISNLAWIKPICLLDKQVLKESLSDI